MLYELFGNLVKMAENLPGPGEHVCFMVGDPLLLAKTLDKLVHFFEVVPWQHGEEVVVHLVLQATTEPVDEPVGRDIARGGDLELPEVGTLVSRVDCHAVVPEAEHQSQKEPTAALRNNKVGERGRNRGHVVQNSSEPTIVENESQGLENGVLHILSVLFSALDAVLPCPAKDKHPALMSPCQTGEKQNREVENGLPPNQKTTIFRILGGFGHSQSPGEDGHGVNIGIAVGSVL